MLARVKLSLVVYSSSNTCSLIIIIINSSNLLLLPVPPRIGSTIPTLPEHEVMGLAAGIMSTSRARSTAAPIPGLALVRADSASGRHCDATLAVLSCGRGDVMVIIRRQSHTTPRPVPQMHPARSRSRIGDPSKVTEQPRLGATQSLGEAPWRSKIVRDKPPKQGSRPTTC